MNDYIEQREGEYWILGSRVSLASIVYSFRQGMAPESIVRAFPTLRLEQIYGAITYYLAHQQRIDAHLEATRKDYEQERERERAADPAFFGRLKELRRQKAAR